MDPSIPFFRQPHSHACDFSGKDLWKFTCPELRCLFLVFNFAKGLSSFPCPSLYEIHETRAVWCLVCLPFDFFSRSSIALSWNSGWCLFFCPGQKKGPEVTPFNSSFLSVHYGCMQSFWTWHSSLCFSRLLFFGNSVVPAHFLHDFRGNLLHFFLYLSGILKSIRKA